MRQRAKIHLPKTEDGQDIEVITGIDRVEDGKLYFTRHKLQDLLQNVVVEIITEGENDAEVN